VSADRPCQVCGGYCIDDDTCYWSVLIGKAYDWRDFRSALRQVRPFGDEGA